MAKYNWQLTLIKGLKYLAFYGLPWAILQWLQYNPEIGSLTVGTLLTMLANWLKHKNK